jgi:hypothetical protein
LHSWLTLQSIFLVTNLDFYNMLKQLGVDLPWANFFPCVVVAILPMILLISYRHTRKKKIAYSETEEASMKEGPIRKSVLGFEQNYLMAGMWHLYCGNLCACDTHLGGWVRACILSLCSLRMHVLVSVLVVWHSGNAVYAHCPFRVSPLYVRHRRIRQRQALCSGNRP